MRKKTLAAIGLHLGNEKILKVETESTRSRPLVKWLWKRLWAYHKTD